MFDVKKIRVTKIEEFATATEAIKSAEEAVLCAGSEKGDLQLTVDDLKKMSEGEANQMEGSVE
jgi:hypothetical protein